MIRKLRGLGVSDPLESVSCYQHRCRRLCSMVKKQHKAVGDVPELIEKRIHGELVSLYPELGAESYLADCLSRCVEKTGRQFVFIIDEWDAPIREAKEDTNAQMAYLNLLREWFKNNNFPGKKLRLIRNVLRMIFKLLGAGMM